MAPSVAHPTRETDIIAEYVLTLSCPDRPGLVHAVSSWLVDRNCNILDSDQFGDEASERFFMRVRFSGETQTDALTHDFASVGAQYDMAWQISDTARKPRVLIMVSKLDHCLLDLLYRTRTGELHIDVPLVISNHPDTEPLVASHGAAFAHLPVSAENKPEQEARVLAAIAEHEIDFIVLARYMQILSAEFCAAMPGRIINIHHSFLPSFKGARPYAQAHGHGVKLIGATAHYVTSDLDEGPIIEQGVERVNHRLNPAQLAAVGRDTERLVLSRAVRYHAEHRVLMNGQRTVVFS